MSFEKRILFISLDLSSIFPHVIYWFVPGGTHQMWVNLGQVCSSQLAYKERWNFRCDTPCMYIVQNCKGWNHSGRRPPFKPDHADTPFCWVSSLLPAE